MIIFFLRECPDHLGSKATLDPPGQRETLDHWDLQDFRGLLVIKVLRVLRDHPA